MSSFLEQLQRKRATLQATSTVVTTPDGRRYIEQQQGEDQGAPPLLEPSCGFVIDTQPDAVPACILDSWLYLGSQDAVSMEAALQYGITHLLSVGIAPPDVPLPVAMQKLFLPCLDLPETPLFESVVPQAVEFIERAHASGGNVLVHCNAGVSRSTSVVIAYLLQQHGMNYDDAYALVKSRRACIQPNDGFRKQLEQFSKSQNK